MKAHELLATPDKWTRRTFAKDKDGHRCNPKVDEAVCFCLYGAVERCYPNFNERYKHTTALQQHLKQNFIIWNDAPERTHAEVLAVLKELDI